MKTLNSEETEMSNMRGKEQPERAFPVGGYRDFPDCPKSVNWSALDDKWARHVHDQTLKRLAERGGLCPIEIVYNVNKLEWGTKVDLKFAVNLVKQIAYKGRE